MINEIWRKKIYIDDLMLEQISNSFYLKNLNTNGIEEKNS